jgi:hypothetical protein
MYGKRRYRPISKSAEQVPVVQQSSDPTFICSKCKQVRPLPPGHIDILVTVENKTKMSYKICWGCSVLLENWIKI